MRVDLVICVGVLSLASWSATARAEPESPEARRDRLYVQAYREPDPTKAVSLLREAFASAPKADLLFRVAQRYEEASRPAEAAAYLRCFLLRASPQNPNRAAAEIGLGRLGGAGSREDTAPECAPAWSASGAAPPPPRAAPTPGPELAPPPLPGGPPNGRRLDAAIPSPERAATALARRARPARSTPARAPAEQAAPGRAVYHRWWFWAGVGAVLVGAAAVTLVTTSGQAAAPAAGYQLTAF